MRLDDPRAVVLNQPDKFAPGTVAVLAGDVGRFTRFAVDIQSLCWQLPPGSSVKWLVGSDISESRNQAAEDMDGEWIWFIDDDHAFPADTLLKLLDRGLDIVAPLVLRRQQPFLPVACVDDTFLDVTRYAADEIVEVEHTGSSGMLIRKKVLTAMDAPWFELGHDGNLPVSEDVTFCRKARAAGFDVHVDTAVRLGHITTAVVQPLWSDEYERWLTCFDIADGARLFIDPPAVKAAEAPTTA